MLVYSALSIAQGDDAYKPSVFGSTITIERRIAATGHSTWTLRDHVGRKVGMTDRCNRCMADLTFNWTLPYIMVVDVLGGGCALVRQQRCLPRWCLREKQGFY